MSDFTGRTVLVTGASTGIGNSIAHRLADGGAHVYLTGRGAAELEKAAETIGDRASAVPGDVSRAADLDRLVEVIADDGRRLDHVVANAGVGTAAPLTEISEDLFDLTFDVNVKGTLLTVQKALPLLDDGASVVLIGSTSAVQGGTGMGAYAATKAAVRSLGRSFAAELASRGIRVNVVSPGPTATAGFAKSGVSSELFLDQIPLRRMADPADVAALAEFLLSGEASSITGAEYHVDGGMVQV